MLLFMGFMSSEENRSSIFSIMRPKGIATHTSARYLIETDTLLCLLHRNERLKMMRDEPNNAEDNDEQLVVQFFCVAWILAFSPWEIVV